MEIDWKAFLDSDAKSNCLENAPDKFSFISFLSSH